MATYTICRASFNGMSVRLDPASYRDCQAQLRCIKTRYETNERYRYNREVQWLIPGQKLEVTDQGLGLIGNDCGIYSIERVEEHA